MRLIDADHLKSMLQEYIKREQAYIDIGNNTSIAVGHSNGLWEAIAQIDEEPTVEPQRKKGKWRTAYLDHEAMGERPKVLYCSECNQCIAYPTHYCPNCGADMRGTDNDA